jgi:trk system potassium uptake protein TrkH
MLVISFAFLILAGTFLLTLPIASADGQPTNFVDALFTATSAVCVTGLIVVDTGTYWSLFGQLVIIVLIQAGGLGIMTITTLMAVLIGKKIKLRERIIMQEALNQLTISGVVRLTLYVIKATLLIEFVGGTILALHWYQDYGYLSIYLGYWHAISSFCNAGFDLLGDYSSLTNYVSDITVNLVVTTLIILGGIGFTVIADIRSNRSFRKLSLHTRIVIVTSIMLIALGTLVILLLEHNNPATLGNLSWPEKLLGSYFQSVSTRTAGYNTISIDKLENATLFFMVILMFIGASPASTGGGIKTSTFGVLMLAIWSILRGKENVEVFQRRISHNIIYKAFSIVFIAAILVAFITMIVSIQESQPFINILFEVVSAFGTVGLSTGITPSLTPLSKVFLIFTMFAGRVGPFTLALAFIAKEKKQAIQYPEGKIIIG